MKSLSRYQDRAADALRPFSFTLDYTLHAEGSVLVTMGETKVLCTASVEDKVPAFLQGHGQGWLTAEYGLLPRSTHTRSPREAVRGQQYGRTMEIQRLIGRSLRSVTDLKLLGERTITLDCDVLQADGGTRCAAINGAQLALMCACEGLLVSNKITSHPVQEMLAAVSVGIVQNRPLLDLDYQEDSSCSTDMNVVMTASGAIVELQGTAESKPFTRLELDELLKLATTGIQAIAQQQTKSLQKETKRVTQEATK